MECVNVVDLKIRIRNAFNPRFADPSQKIAPLNAGVSHEHCIHGSDYEEQTEYVLKLLNLDSLSYYKRYDDSEYFFPYHLNVETYSLVDVPIDTLKANIIGKGAVSLQETPHYKYINGKSEDYIQYFYGNFGTNLCEDHFPEAFEKLILNFDPNYIREDGKESHIIINTQNIILDGVHRAVILKNKGITQVTCLQVIDQDNSDGHYSNLIDLQEYFENCPHEYCIIKMNGHFPNYYNYSDVDILCPDIKALVEYTKTFSEKYAGEKLKFIVNPLEEGHVHVDVYPEGKSLNFKFDFMDNLQMYKSFSVDDALMKNVFRGKVLKQKVFVPSTAYDLAIRYMEYVEYDRDRPDKIKHYEYVNQHPEHIDDVLKVIKRHTNIMEKSVEKAQDSSGIRRSMSIESCQSPTYRKFYPISDTCQVPKLSLIYEQYFGKRTDGTFVEVGAYDGEYVSNTSGLSDVGWTGLYFEPVPSFSEKCKARHANNKNVRVVNTAVGDHDGVVTIHIWRPPFHN